MELRHLNYFVAVAEELNFNRAAERLLIAQPSLSCQIQDLEKELGVRLFERNKRKVELTFAGTILLDKARYLLSETAHSIQEVRKVAQRATKRLAIGLPKYGDYSLIFEILDQFGEHFPEVELVISDLDLLPAQVYDKLFSGTLAAAFAILPPSQPQGLKWQSFQREALAVVLPENHHLAQQPQIGLEALAGKTTIFTLPHLRLPLSAQLRETSQTTRLEIEPTQLYTALSLVRAGLGVAVVPAGQPDFKWPGVVCKVLDEVLELKLVWRGDNAPGALDAFLEIAKVAAVHPQARNRANTIQHAK